MSARAATAAVGANGGGVTAGPATESQRRALIELAREIARRELLPAAARLDASDEDAIAACWRTICEVGLDRALLAESDGGAGIEPGDLLAAIEELAVGDSGTALSVLLANVALVALPARRAAVIPAGERWATVPLSWGAQVTLSGARLMEISTLALGAHRADGLVFMFPASTDARGSGSRALYAARSAAQLQLARDEHQLGLGGAPAAKVTLRATWDDCEPDPPWLDGIGGGSAGSRCLFEFMRQGAAAVARGIARHAKQLALEYAYARHQGGVAIIEHDAVRDMLGAMMVREVCQPCHAPAGPGSEAKALAAKIAGCDAAIATTTDAVQVLGGTGYMRPTGAEKLMRDAKCLSLFPEPGWVAQDMLMRISGGREQGSRP